MLDSLILTIVNAAFVVVSFLCTLLGGGNWNRMIDMFLCCLNSSEKSKKSVKLVPPHHLALLYVNPTAIDQFQIFEILKHAATHGINRITLYDPWGKLFKRKTSLADDANTYFKETNTSIIVVLDFAVPSNESNVHFNIKYLHLSILGPSSGKTALVNACKKLSHLPRPITSADIDAELVEEFIFEPDFVLKIGKPSTLAGYPPWSLRVSEICSINSLPSVITSEYFGSLISDYSLRERRIGS